MEFSSPELELVPLSKEMMDKITSANERIGSLDDDEARLLVSQLNQDAIDQGILGESVQLVTDFAVANKITLNPKRVQFDTVKTDLLPGNTKIYGMFAGFEEYRVGDEVLLLYKVEKALDETTMSFETISAPVGGAKINMIELASDGVQEEAEHEIFENLQILAQVEDPKFKEDFKDFTNLIENTDIINETFLTEIGTLCTWMLTCEEVRNRLDLRQAMVKILSLLFDSQDYYFMLGHEFKTSSNESGKKTIEINIIDVASPVSGVQLITDYTLHESGSKHLIDIEETLQPALVLVDSKGQNYYMPFKHLSKMTKQEYYDLSCYGVLDRFRRQNMTIGDYS